MIEQDSVGSSTYLWGNFTNDGSVDVEQGLFEMGFVYGTPVTTISTGTVYGAPGTILAFTGNQILQAPSDPSQDSINGDTVYFGDSGNGSPGEYGNGSVTVQGAYNATTATVFYAGDTLFQGPVVSIGTSLEVSGGSADFTGTTAEARTLQTLTVNGTLTSNDPYTVTGTTTITGVFIDSATSQTADLDWTSGYISGTGDLVVTGMATLQATPGYPLYLVNGSLTLQGTTSWVNTTVIGYTGTEDLINEGTLTFSGTSYFSLEYVEASFTNDGVIEQDSVGSSTYLWGNFTNDGSVDVEQGLFEMGFVYGTPVTTISTGTVYGAPGTILAFTGNQILQAPSDPSQDSINGDTVYFGDSGNGSPGEYGNGSVTVQGAYNATTATVFYAGDTLFQGPVVSIGTSLEVSGGSADFTGTTAEARTLQTLTVNGTLTSNDPYTVTGTTTITGVFIDSATSQTADLDWTSGNIGGTGDLTVTGSALFQNVLYLKNGTLTLAGTTDWDNAEMVGYTGTETLVNEGTLTFQGTSYYTFEYVVAAFVNDGTIQQDSSGSNTYLYTNFTNDGSVDVEQGLLWMGYVYSTPVTTTSTGTVYGAPGTTLVFFRQPDPGNSQQPEPGQHQRRYRGVRHDLRRIWPGHDQRGRSLQCRHNHDRSSWQRFLPGHCGQCRH